MLKITPYLGILVIIVCVGGIWYPMLGYLVPLVFAAIMITSPFRGRWFCGNLCPRGSFNDFWVSRISMGRRIPSILRSMWIRVPIFLGLMGFMLFRLVQTRGLVELVGTVFVTMCILTTAISLLFGVIISPRAWCSFCPLGTVGRWLGRGKYQLQVDREKCVDCGVCKKVCPMHLEVNEILDKPDCIKCQRCVEACPREALHF
ncbi:MAG: 4Fe-4S binding protein [Methanosarcinales archaeon]|nr:4Fe-4S binding protein [Methanosarcinales archaeon]